MTVAQEGAFSNFITIDAFGVFWALSIVLRFLISSAFLGSPCYSCLQLLFSVSVGVCVYDHVCDR